MNKINITDLDLNFSAHPVSGDVSIKTNNDAIKQSIKNILFYSSLEKPFNTQFNLNLREYLFLNWSILYETDLKKQIFDILSTYEPRITINAIQITVDPDNHTLSISIDYSIIGQNNIEESVEVMVERTR